VEILIILGSEVVTSTNEENLHLTLTALRRRFRRRNAKRCHLSWTTAFVRAKISIGRMASKSIQNRKLHLYDFLMSFSSATTTTATASFIYSIVRAFVN